MTNYQDYAYHQVVFKSSHNSYDRQEKPLGRQLDFHPQSSNYYNCGCRGLELDIWRHSQSDPNSADWFTVNHLTNGGPQLKYYLDQLINWHTANPGHDVIWVSLDVKSWSGDKSTFPDELDRYLTNFLGRDLILSPKDMFSELTDTNFLSDLVKATGWPKLSAMTRKFIFCLSGDEDWKKYYAEHQPSVRLCLADCESVSTLLSPNKRAVYNVKAGDEKHSDLSNLKAANILARVYDADGDDDWDDAQTQGATIIATDKVSDHSWAAVSSQAPYSAFELRQ
ncbi:Ca2+-dependent phosphoinositide-specific phospholipase C [Arundinibacter roseus]|nr:Ca2+-dependent phosphoinositide-specific phospholipase C [Arundinibacter roseus]